MQYRLIDHNHSKYCTCNTSLTLDFFNYMDLEVCRFLKKNYNNIMIPYNSIVTFLRSYSLKSVLRCNYNKTAQFGIIQDRNLSDALIPKLSTDDATKEKKLKALMLQIEVMRQNGEQVPKILKDKHWHQLLKLQTWSQIKKHLIFIWKNEMKNENFKARKEARKKLKNVSYIPEYPDDISYGLNYQSLFLRIESNAIDKFNNYRALQVVPHTTPTVIDCSFEKYMTHRERQNAAKQLKLSYGSNREHPAPLNLHLCNVNLKGDFMNMLRGYVPNIETAGAPLTIHSEDFLNIFPREKLIYLTPHCYEELNAYDPDAIYIVGCIVDKAGQGPLSLAEAKKKHIKMAKLPLDKYLEFAPMSKRILNIDHMAAILADIRQTGDWEFALRHVPRRLLMQSKLAFMQKQVAFSTPSLKSDISTNTVM